MDILSNAEFDRILRYALLGAQRTDWDRIMDTDAAVLPEPIFSPRYLRRRARMLKEPFRNIDGIEFYRIGDDIFSGDEKLATVKHDAFDGIMPITGWTYVENCPFGTRSDYAKHISNADRVWDVELNNSVSSFTVAALAGITGLAIGNAIPGLSGQIAGVLAAAAAGQAKVDAPFGNTTALYVKERVMGHETLSSIYRMSVFFMYKGAALKNPIEDAVKIMYQYRS